MRLIATVVAILGLAVCLRIGTFASSHTDPVELAYLTLAMKMGMHPGLSGYHIAGTEIRRTEVAETDAPDRRLPIAVPVTTDPGVSASFDAWPRQDPNPFLYKPPFFPALLTYSHHQFLGPRFPHYPVSAADASADGTPRLSRALIQMQGWAVLIPFLSGLATVLMTFVAGRRMFGNASGAWAAGLMAVYPAQLLLSARIWPESTLTVCLLTAFVLFHRFTTNRNAAGCLIAGGVWGVAALTDTAAVLFLPAFAVWAFWERKELLNRYLLTFAAGAAVVYKVWPEHLHRTFDASVFRSSDVSSASASGFVSGALPLPVETMILWIVPAAAIVSTLLFLKNRSAAPSGEREGRNIVLLWGIVLSVAAVRLAISPEAPWDARAFAPILPFVAILAARKRCVG